MDACAGGSRRLCSAASCRARGSSCCPGRWSGLGKCALAKTLSYKKLSTCENIKQCAYVYIYIYIYIHTHCITGDLVPDLALRRSPLSPSIARSSPSRLGVSRIRRLLQEGPYELSPKSGKLHKRFCVVSGQHAGEL